jgi:hypothetical protein
MHNERAKRIAAGGGCKWFCVLALALPAFSLGGCFERRQDAVLNPDGSGKVLIQTDVAVPAAGAPGREKPTALSFGRQYAADLINSTKGVDAWSDVAITENADGRAHVAIVAYFSDINALHFDMPLRFIWKADGPTGVLAIERLRTDVKSKANISETEIKSLVSSAQQQYKSQQGALHLQLAAFRLQMVFQLPGDVDAASRLFDREGQAVSIALDGRKISEALDKFMANDEALAATFRAGKDTSDNDDLMLQSMFGQKGPVAVRVKLPAGTKPLFDYKTEMAVAKLGQHDMLTQAGVDLIPRFIVNPPATTSSR